MECPHGSSLTGACAFDVYMVNVYIVADGVSSKRALHNCLVTVIPLRWRFLGAGTRPWERSSHSAYRDCSPLYLLRLAMFARWIPVWPGIGSGLHPAPRTCSEILARLFRSDHAPILWRRALHFRRYKSICRACTLDAVPLAPEFGGSRCRLLMRPEQWTVETMIAPN